MGKLIYFYFLNMDVLESAQGVGKKGPLTIGVLNVPARSTLVSVPSPSSEYPLLQEGKKKMTMEQLREATQVQLLLAKLPIFL